jgi:prepilin-type N-terminal cleavage/methylation domain-containing protein
MTRSERGMSLIEVTVVLAIVSVLMIGVYRMLEETMSTTMFVESHNELTIMTQKAINTLQSEVLQSKMMFEENTLGQSYRNILRLPTGVSVWTDSLFPVIDPGTTMAPDAAGARRTGNALLIVQQLPPRALSVNHDNNSSTPNIEFLADRYRFYYVFLQRSSRSFGQTGYSLDLVGATSTLEYADYFQLSGLGSALGPVAQQLLAAGITRAWNPGQTPASAFYAVSPAVSGSFAGPLREPTIALDRPRSLLPGLNGGSITGHIVYSIAFNPPSSAPFPLRIPISQFARADSSRPGFPSGFEAKIVGPAGNRQAMMRLVALSNYNVKSYEAQQGFVITATR